MWAANWYTGTGSIGDTFYFNSIEAVVKNQTVEAQLQENTITASLGTVSIEATVMDDNINLDLETLEIEAGKSCD